MLQKGTQRLGADSVWGHPARTPDSHSCLRVIKDTDEVSKRDAMLELLCQVGQCLRIAS